MIKMIKMKKIVGLTMVLAMAMLLNVPSAFAWYYDIRNPDHDNTVEIYFTPDEGGNLVETMNFAFGYDGDLVDGGSVPPPNLADPLSDTLDWSLETYTFDMPTFTEGGSGANNYAPEDMILNFSGYGAATLTEETLVGTITFAGTAVTDGYADMWWGRIDEYYTSSVDSVVYNTGTNPGNFVDTLGAGIADVAAVPIPGAVFLLGSGLLGLIGIRKKLSA